MTHLTICVIATIVLVAAGVVAILAEFRRKKHEEYDINPLLKDTDGDGFTITDLQINLAEDRKRRLGR